MGVGYVAPEGYVLVQKDQYEFFMELQRRQLMTPAAQPLTILRETRKPEGIRFRSQISIWSAFLRGILPENAEILLFPGERILYHGQTYKDVSSVVQLLRRQYIPSANQTPETKVFVCMDTEATLGDLFIGERFEEGRGEVTLWELDGTQEILEQPTRGQSPPETGNYPQMVPQLQQQAPANNPTGPQTQVQAQQTLERGIREAGQAAKAGQNRRIKIPGLASDQSSQELAEIRRNLGRE